MKMHPAQLSKGFKSAMAVGTIWQVTGQLFVFFREHYNEDRLSTLRSVCDRVKEAISQAYFNEYQEVPFSTTWHIIGYDCILGNK